MSNFIDLTGQKFGKLIVIQRMNNNKCRDSCWMCRCDCGQETIVRSPDIKNGHTKSCGCLVTKHGYKRNNKTSKVYAAWNEMIQRCTNPNNKYYKDYGGRGITICQRWKKFTNFLEDIREPPTKNHSIHRINNHLGYDKENCRWATKKEQARNRRDNHLKTYNKKIQCIAAWAEEAPINKHTFWSRINRGWSIEEALTIPVSKRRKKCRI